MHDDYLYMYSCVEGERYFDAQGKEIFEFKELKDNGHVERIANPTDGYHRSAYEFKASVTRKPVYKDRVFVL